MFSKQSLRLARLKTAAVLTIVWLWLVSLTGCSSEDPNLVGVGLGQTSIEESMLYFPADSVTSVSVLDIVEANSPYAQADVLYFGSTDRGDSSSILVNYDFRVFDHPDSAYYFDVEQPDSPAGGYLGWDNITAVEILLYMLTWYEPHRGLATPNPDVKPWLGAKKIYEVWQLAEPFDAQDYPGATPARAGGPYLNTELGRSTYNSGTIYISCQKGPFVNAIRERKHIGIKIREGTIPGGEVSEPGVLGFASKEMRYAGSTLPQLGAATVLGPALRLKLDRWPPQWTGEGRREWLVITPSADVSTWHALEEPHTDPDDGIMVRTHLRSYPVLHFDLSELPPNVRINRANLVVVNDTTRSMGRQSILTCSEIPRSFVPPGRTTIDLADLEPQVHLLFGSASWDPEHISEHVLRFNVTSSLQRHINHAHDEQRSFLLAGGESIFPRWRSTPRPDFWFTKWVFYGSSAPEELRPRLEIFYTRLDELTGAGGG